uniref:Uncharacterized protein n=1 Tax=Anguilla anguilla TaxID=7936 RepID=A0A0E9W3U8_ANGAN
MKNNPSPRYFWSYSVCIPNLTTTSKHEKPSSKHPLSSSMH